MDSYTKLFSYLVPRRAPRALTEAILRQVAEARRRMLRLRFFFFGLGTLGSLVTLVPVLGLFVEKVTTTGFYQYLSLALSGDGAVYLFWKELLWSLLETAPLMSLLGVLSVLTVVIWSVAQTITVARRLSIA